MMGGLVLFFSACNSDLPEPAGVDLPAAGIQLRIVRIATHPFLARYRLTLEVEGPQGCLATAELFPDTGYVGRRNLYQRGFDTFLVLGQYDARVIDLSDCTIHLIEFQSVIDQGRYLGAFDADGQKRWSYFVAGTRPERPFEKP